MPTHHLRRAGELADNALLDKRLVGVRARATRRGLADLVAGLEGTSGPAGPAEVDVRVVVEHIKLLAHVSEAAVGVRATTSLGQHGLAVVLAEPVTEALEGVGVGGGALSVGARAVRVEVLVHIEDQVVGRAILVGNLVQSGSRAVRDGHGGVGPVVAREEDLKELSG